VFERFTADARQAVAEAQIEARALRHDQIESAHLLIGCARAGGSVGAVLPPADTMRDELARLAGQGDHQVARLPFSPHAKRALALALEEALARDESFLNVRHLVLGVLRDGDELAYRLIDAVGLDRDKLRAELVAAADDGPDGGELLLTIYESDAVVRAALGDLGIDGDRLRAAVERARASRGPEPG
jgi:ATP-dependent Clp protease ATP-binding subunit ClpC